MSNYSKLVSVRIDSDVLKKIDKLANGSVIPNRSYYINRFLEFCVNHLQSRDIYRITWNDRRGLYELNEIGSPEGCNTNSSK